MRLPVLLDRAVIKVKGGTPHGLYLSVGGNGLASSTHAPAGASHDFDEVIIRFTGPDRVHHLSGIP